MTTRRPQLSLIIMAQHGFLLAILCEENDVLSYWSPKRTFFLFAVLSTFMKRSLNRNIGYCEETVPAYFGDEFASLIFGLVATPDDGDCSLRSYKPG